MKTKKTFFTYIRLEYLAIFALVIAAFLLSIWKINTNPPSLNWDETSLAYNAYSILKTGTDEWGVKLPLIFKAFGDYKLPLYVYLSTIPISLGGLTVLSTRFVSILSGSVAILGIYLLAKQICKSKSKEISWFAIFSAFVLLMLPWHFFISRIALEANLALTLLIFGIWSLLKALDNPRYYILASLFLGLSIHTYNTARVFVPLLLVVFVLLYRQRIKLNTQLLISSLVIVTAFIIVALQIINGSGTARYQKLAILSPNTVYTIGKQRTESKLPPLLAKIVYNRPTYLAITFSKNYISYFSPDFLYQTWGAQAQFAIPGVNLLGLPTTILFITGLLIAIKNYKKNHNLFLLSILFLSPIAAALTVDPPQALRPNPMIIPIVLLASVGIGTVTNLFRHSKTTFVLANLIILGTIGTAFVKYQFTYQNYYRTTYSASWQYGYKEVVDFIINHQAENTKFIITKRYGEPHIFYAFYSKLEPKVLQSSQSIRFAKSDWFWTDKIQNVYFVNDWDIPHTSVNQLPIESGGTIDTRGAYLITSPTRIPINAHVEQTISFLDGSPAFVITRLP